MRRKSTPSIPGVSPSVQPTAAYAAYRKLLDHIRAMYVGNMKRQHALNCRVGLLIRKVKIEKRQGYADRRHDGSLCTQKQPETSEGYNSKVIGRRFKTVTKTCILEHFVSYLL